MKMDLIVEITHWKKKNDENNGSDNNYNNFICKTIPGLIIL